MDDHSDHISYPIPVIRKKKVQLLTINIHQLSAAMWSMLMMDLYRFCMEDVLDSNMDQKYVDIPTHSPVNCQFAMEHHSH